MVVPQMYWNNHGDDWESRQVMDPDKEKRPALLGSFRKAGGNEQWYGSGL